MLDAVAAGLLTTLILTQPAHSKPIAKAACPGARMPLVARKDRSERRRRRSVPLVLHGLVEYGEGILTIIAPFVFSFDSNGATVLAILIGAAVLVLAVVTVAPTGLSRTLPLASHIVLDYVLVAVWISFPFIFGFSDDGAALAYFLIVGVAHLLMTVSTRYRKVELPG